MISQDDMNRLADKIELGLWRDYHCVPGDVSEILSSMREGVYTDDDNDH